MINKNELRIGNWVAFPNPEFKPLRILDGKMIDNRSSSSIPISLSHEILEKCGFKKSLDVIGVTGGNQTISQNKFSIEAYEGHLQLSSALNLFEGSIDEKESDKGYYQAYLIDPEDVIVYLRPIYYLHDLQNLYYALTTRDLTVNGLEAI